MPSSTVRSIRFVRAVLVTLVATIGLAVGCASNTNAAVAGSTTIAVGTTAATGDRTVVTVAGIATIKRSALPKQGQHTLDLIAKGGPFPYKQDGVVFQNRESRLPKKAKGYYREYTVKTPGSSDRGARRVVTGAKGEQFYTDDHYASFRQVVPG